MLSCVVTATSWGFNTFNVLPKVDWSLIALISFIIFALSVGWGWYSAEKHIRQLEMEAVNPNLQKAQEKHEEHIKELIEFWNISLVIPPIPQITAGTSSFTIGLEDKRLFNRLKEHLRSQTLWQDYSQLDGKLREYLNTCKELREQIRDSWKIEGTQSTPQFAIPILKLIAGEKDILTYSLSIDKDHTLEEVGYQILVVDSTEVVRGLETLKSGCYFNPLSGEQSKKQTLAIEYQKLADEYLLKDITAKTKQLFSELKELETRIHDSLQEILERCDYLRYGCKQCPKPPIVQQASRMEGYQS